MNRITMDAYAKINLALDVLHRREDGYHDIRMIMQQIDLKDIISIEEIEEGIIIESNSPDVPKDASNLVYKAWKLLSDRYNISKGVYINIDKKIPVAAGLAGGSSNAAAVLKGLNALWGLGIPQEELMALGLEIGADVPYCILGGTALAEGIGERLTKLKDFSNKLVLIAKPDIGMSTAYVYNNLNLANINERPDIDRLIKHLENNQMNRLKEDMVNVLENVTIKTYPMIQRIKDQILNHGAQATLMSGSGPTVFGLFDSEERIEKCRVDLKKWINTVYSVKTI